MTWRGWIVAAALFAGGAARADGEVDVNTASRDQLEALPAIGAKLASEIVRDRDENGPFSAVEDLTRVPGITPSLLGKIRDKVRIASGEGPLVIQEGKVISSEIVRKVLARYAGEPSIKEVQDRAMAYGGLHPDIVESWRWRSRANAIAPTFTVTSGGKVDTDTRQVKNLELGTAPTQTETAQQTGDLELKAQWDLNKLIFEPQELGVAREGARMTTLRDRILDDVTRRYFERRRLQVDLELSPPTELADRVRKELRLQELTADIDALTGGYFSEKLTAAGRAPY